MSSALPEVPPFPTDVRTLTIPPAEYAAGGIRLLQFSLKNPHSTVLHVRLNTDAGWLSVIPGEVALGANETQTVLVRTDMTRARAAVRADNITTGPVQLTYQRLYPASRGITPTPPETGSVYIALPVANCPNCKRSLDEAMASGDISLTPEACPFCYERLRPCPVCGTLNSWLARTCLRDASHIVRSEPDWGMLGANPAHTGSVPTRAIPVLSRRWSFPTTPPLRRENAYSWSAPAAAYGLVAAAATTPEGEALIFAFDARNGATLWEAYPLPDPVYPDRGGVAIADGKLFVATVEGVCLALDVQRGTRLWERKLPGRVFGTVVPCEGLRTQGAGSRTQHPIPNTLLVAVTVGEREGALFVLDCGNGEVRHRIALGGPPDTAPAYENGLAFVQDDGGTLTAIVVESGTVAWSATGTTGFNAAPVVRNGTVYSANGAGVVHAFDAQTGEERWQLAVTNAPFSGTPAHDGTLLYLPADDGLHLVSTSGRAVRRYPTRLPVRSAPVIADGTLFFGSMDGIVYGAAAGRPLEKLYETATTGSQIFAAPALADGALFVAATNGVLYALGTTNGAGVT